MKAGVKVALAVTAWLLLLVPLWAKTILVSRAHLDLEELQRYEALGASPVFAYIPIAVYGEYLPDIAPATELVLNRDLEDLGSARRFSVAAECSTAAELCVNVKLGEHNILGLNNTSSHLEVTIDKKTMVSGTAAEIVGLLLFEHIYKDEVLPETMSREELTVSYSPKFHLTFSLLGEGGATLDWDIAEALQQYMAPLISDINATVASVTIDAQTGSYAALGCERKPEIEESDLSTFVDFAEWSLASILPYPTLNFVLYVPTSPLEIVGKDRANSFIIPQWGGIYVAKPHAGAHHFSAADLEPMLQRFSKQLLALLGMREPLQYSDASKASPRVRLNKLAREYTSRGVRQAMASLGSLRRLAENMPLIAIPDQVAERVQTAMAAIDNALVSLKQCRGIDAAHYTAVAFESADQAFFDKHMVAQAFFPDDQKLAVYMPLIGPLCIVVFSCWFRFVKQRKAAKAVQKEKPRN